MSKTAIKKFTFIYGICLMVLTIVVGALFITQTWAIFASKPASAFTREIIQEKFMEIAVPVWLWVGAVVVGGVLGMAFPQEEPQPKAYISVSANLQRLKSRLPKNEGGMVEVNRESLSRIIVCAVCVACCLIATIISFIYLLNKNYVPNFTAEFFTSHGGAADRLLSVLPWTVGALLLCVLAWTYHTYSVKKETRLVKEKIAENARKGVKFGKVEKTPSFFEKLCVKYPILKSKWWKYGLQIGLGVLGIVLVIIGICNHGVAYDVFDKARKICTQCIGLG